ncbi:phage tail sheath protein FI [Sedimentibacter acidaminivorans]|uniref:Phage tail sheath protein FI n=1 Tax=Sedimentibacter acidaminivorans TaxID=913099 RepID=A0ABS4GGM4_9FIRM|nr:hypothetical protein [Sedimentibacter acidaminivorans]MBP1926848.1 phage tail sheath protein FI [Sedimentibacter acidaminivorans]
MYKHGIYGERVPSEVKIEKSTGTIPLYVGTAPVFRTNNPQNINTPIIISTLNDAIEKFGYNENDDFEVYTLCGCIFAHLSNAIKPIGPIILVNVLDGSKVESEATTKTINLINGIGYIEDDLDISTISITDLDEGIDYSAEYEGNKVKIVVTASGVGNSIDISYKKIDKIVTDMEIVTGLDVVDTIYQTLNVVPNILVTPGFNSASVESALVNKSYAVDGNMEAIAVTDIDSKVVKTIDDAIAWKNTNKFVSTKNKTCWPRFKVGGKIIYASIIAAVTMQIVDSQNDNVPYESPSNKTIDITSMVVGQGQDVSIIKFNKIDANRLNEKGITTALFNGGKWVLWGPHMSNYEYGVTEKADEIFDSSVRTNIYLNTDFIVRNADIVDSPLARNDIDSIINTEQARLNSLVSDGKLLYAKIDFIANQNVDSDLINGDFVFNSDVTNTPPAKSITNKVQYVNNGLSKLTGGTE